MYISWSWIKKKLDLDDNNYDLKLLVDKLNHLGLECEISSDNDYELFIIFIPVSNRKDLKSWWGILREISILLGIRVKDSFLGNDKNSLLEGDSLVKIKTKKVIEYNYSIIKNVKINNSPKWIKSCLNKNQIKSVNALVDIGNFIMLETGQPIHIFDYDKIDDKKREIFVREANDNESLSDIHGVQRLLKKGDIVISTIDKIICLAGIIGERYSAVSELTKNILIESAIFEPLSIKKTSERINLKTKSSEIFSKLLNQESAAKSLFRTIQLIKENCSFSGQIHHYRNKDSLKKETILKTITISHQYINKRLGAKVKQEKIIEILNRLKFKNQLRKSTYCVEIPSYRDDISIKEDLIEEILKILDYNSIAGFLPSFNNQFIDKKSNFKYDLKKKISIYLQSVGYQEIISYSLTKIKEKGNEKKLDLKKCFEVLSPKSSNYVSYRSSFVKSHLEITDNNIKQGINEIFLFEIGNTYSKKNNNILESEILSLIGYGNVFYFPFHSLKQKIDFYWIKGILENIFLILDLNNFSYLEKGIDNLKPKQSLEIIYNEKVVGFIGQIEDKVLKSSDKKNDFFVLQLSIGHLLEASYQKKTDNFFDISYLPMIKKDISFFIKKTVKIEKILEIIKKSAGEFLTEATLYDVYKTDNHSSNEHSLSFRLFFQGKEENLRNKYIEEKIKNILRNLNLTFSIKER